MTEIVQIVEIVPAKVWIESDIFGARHVVLEHGSWGAFTYATFHYRYGYTDNQGTMSAATRLAIDLGATEPVEHRRRELPKEWLTPTTPTKGPTP